jgi:hypothetical protein
MKPGEREKTKEELDGWSYELAHLQKLQPLQNSIDRLKTDEIPSLERKIEGDSARLPELSRIAEEVSTSK